jgi:hypothetical protein
MHRYLLPTVLLLSIRLSAPAAAQDVSYTFTTIDVPGATSTWASGINDAGQIVSSYEIIGAGDHGYLRDTYGSFTTIDVPRGNNGTNAVGINNAGQFVGNYFAGGANHGFLRDIDGRFITIDFPGAIGTSLRGINNAGEIVGSYSDSSGTHGFVAKVAALTFAGTSGKPNCHGQSVAALARQFGNLDAAATALRFPSVQALQRAIRAFCKDSRSPEAVRKAAEIAPARRPEPARS